MQAEIYALLDPRTDEVRYIGKANNAAKRLQTHLRDAHRRDTPVYRWMRKLLDLGMRPRVEVLEVTADWREAEMRLIAVTRARGVRLLNVAEGGDQPYCAPEVRAANGRKVAALRKNDPLAKRIWEIKRTLGAAYRKGELSEHAVNCMRVAAVRNPHIFGHWANLPYAHARPV